MALLGRSKEEIELTKKLAATLVQKEVIEPMSAMGWGHGQVPSTQQAAVVLAEEARGRGVPEDQIAAFLKERGVTFTPNGGQPAKTEGAPAPAAAPVAPASSGQPAKTETPAPVVPAAKTDASVTAPADQNVLSLFESLRDASGKIMGKYTTVEEALKGAGHLANMAKTALRRAEEAEGRLAAIPASGVAAPLATAPVAAPARKPFTPTPRLELVQAEAHLAKVLAKVNESGFDGDSAKEYAEATREVAKQTSLAVAAEERERTKYDHDVEESKWKAVNEYMSSKYPESANMDPNEFSLFMSLNPMLSDAVSALRAQGNETRAVELGYTEFIKARGGVAFTPPLPRAEAEKKEIELSEREQVRKEARDEALKDAGIVHGSAGGSSAVETPGITGATQEDINAMAQAMIREGQTPGGPAGAAWRRAVIKLPPELFSG